MAQDKSKQDKTSKDKQRKMDTPAQDAPPQGGATNTRIQGEGDYEAARRYDEKTREYVQSHDVEDAARDAEPASEGERRDMERAEEAGKRRAKEEDRLLERPESIDNDGMEGEDTPR
jgi:hypothetical protein